MQLIVKKRKKIVYFGNSDIFIINFKFMKYNSRFQYCNNFSKFSLLQWLSFNKKENYQNGKMFLKFNRFYPWKRKKLL